MYYDQLLALSELRHDVNLWHFASREASNRFDQWTSAEPATWAIVQSRCASVELHTYADDEGVVDRIRARVRSLLPPRLPVSRWPLQRELTRKVARTRPDFIWAQHFEPALLAVQQPGAPVVYVH